MLHAQDICNCLNSITYKPGWQFDLAIPAKSKGYIIQAIATVQDVDDLSVSFPISCEHLGEFESEQEIVDLVGKLILQIEKHEFKEWFKVKGKRVKEPKHP